jgi:hypothetical protein
MIRQSLRIVTALLGFVALGATAKAQVLDQIVVDVPFEFVVGGKTLPAGAYRANRVSLTGDRFEGLILRSLDNPRASVMVLPTEVEDARGDNAQLTFERVGGQHFLSKIDTGDNVYNIQVLRSTTLLASTPSPSGAVPGSAGSN